MWSHQVEATVLAAHLFKSRFLSEVIDGYVRSWDVASFSAYGNSIIVVLASQDHKDP